MVSFNLGLNDYFAKVVAFSFFLCHFFIRGKDSATEEAFRKDYGRLAELRSLLHRDVPFVALTATATEATRNTIIKDLCMQSCVQILGDPNKPNIRYVVVDIDHGDLYETFKSVIDDIDERQLSATKVMVFCRRKEDMKELFELFSQSLGPKAYVRPQGTEPMDDRTRLFAMYHKKTHDLVKRTIETEFCKENGSVRVVFCTIAFGMGINVKGGNVVMHLGPSSGVDDYLQESGRVGRNNESAHAILLRYKGCTRSRNITKEMKQYTKNETVCRRTLLLKSFTASPTQNKILHTCCDICADQCKCLCACGCKECVCEEKCNKSDHQSSFEKLLKHKSVSEGKSTSQQIRSKVQGQKAKVLRDNLFQYRMQLAGNLSHEQLITGLDLATGFSHQLIDSIVSCVRDINSIEMLLQKFNFFDRSQAEYVWQCLCELSETSSSGSNNSAIEEISESDDSDIGQSFVRRHRHYVLDSTDDSE